MLNTIGLMLIIIVFTFAVFVLSYFYDTLLNAERFIITQIDFKSVLLDVMLSFLLFAGALHTNFEQLKGQRWPVLVFARLGVLLSAFFVGFIMFYTLPIVGLHVDFIYYLET